MNYAAVVVVALLLIAGPAAACPNCSGSLDSPSVPRGTSADVSRGFVRSTFLLLGGTVGGLGVLGGLLWLSREKPVD